MRSLSHLRLTEAQRYAILHGSAMHYLGARQNGVQGSVMAALERKALADTRWERKPYRHLTYRLTDEAGILRAGWALETATRPATHTPIPTRCSFCGQDAPDAPDGTPGGSCGGCGQEVYAIADCCCPEGLVQRGGFRSSCKVHGVDAGGRL